MTQAATPFCTAQSDLASCDTSNLVALPTKVTTSWLFTTPMTNAAAVFPSERQVFLEVQAGSNVTTGGIATESDLIGGTQLDCPFLMCGICISLTPEPLSAGMNGMIFDLGTYVDPNPGTTPQNDGTDSFAGVAGRHLGTYDFGSASWLMAVHFLLAYHLRFVLQCKYELFDFPLSDIGCIDSVGGHEGDGSGTVAMDERIRAANLLYAQLGLSDRFLAQNIYPAVPPTTPASLAMRPRAGVTWGGPAIEGNLNGYFMCPFPVLLVPCCRINMELFTNGVVGEHARQKLIEDASPVPKTSVAPEWSTQISGIANQGAAAIAAMKLGDLYVTFSMVGAYLESNACFQYSQSGVPPRAYLDLLQKSGFNFSTGTGPLARG